MIAGIFLRNIKCYGNLNFIPLTYQSDEKLSVFIGENGSGKSTILEAIDLTLNDIDSKNWEITLNQKKIVSHICPVFLIKKDQIKHSTHLEAISNSFWNHDVLQINRSEPIDRFQKWREKLKKTLTQMTTI